MKPGPRARIVDMAHVDIESKSPVCIVFEVPASMEGLGEGMDILDEIIKTKLPPELQHDGNWAIKALHDHGCRAQETRSMDDCTCTTLVCECFQIDDGQEAILRKIGGYELEMEMGGDPDAPSSFN